MASLAPGESAGRAGARVLGGISAFWLALGLLSDGLVTLILPVHLERSGEAGAAAFGLLAFIGLAAGAVVQPFAGAVSDRLRPAHGRRVVLVTGGFSAVAGLGLLAGAGSVATVLLAFVTVQVAVAVAQAAQQGYLPDLVPADQRGVAAGLKGLADVGGAAVGFVVLGALLDRRGSRFALAAAAVGLLVGLAVTLLLVQEPRRRPVASHRPLRQVLVIDPARDRSFLVLVAARFVFLLGTFAVGRFFLFFVEDRVIGRSGGAALEAGALLGVLALVTAVAAPPAGWAADRFERHPVMLAGAVTSAAGVGLLVFARSPGAVLAFGGLMSIGSATFSVANWARIADVAPAAEAGRYLALANLGTAGAAAAAGMLGLLVDRGGSGPGGGYGALFAVCALLFATSAWIVAHDLHRDVDVGSASQVNPDKQEVDHA